MQQTILLWKFLTKENFNKQHQIIRMTLILKTSWNVSKYQVLTGKDVLTQKYLLEKAATIKRFEYSPLGKKLKAQNDTAKKQYQKLDNTYEFDKIIKKEKPKLEKYSKSDLI